MRKAGRSAPGRLHLKNTHILGRQPLRPPEDRRLLVRVGNVGCPRNSADFLLEIEPVDLVQHAPRRPIEIARGLETLLLLQPSEPRHRGALVRAVADNPVSPAGVTQPAVWHETPPPWNELHYD